MSRCSVTQALHNVTQRYVTEPNSNDFITITTGMSRERDTGVTQRYTPLRYINTNGGKTQI